MKLALVQLHIHWENKAKSLLRIQRLFERLRAEQPDLVLLPEMSLTGFSMQTELTKESHGETLKAAQSLARQYQTTIGIGWVKDCGKLCENHYSLVSASSVLLDAVKLHPFRLGGESEFFSGGTALAFGTVCGFRMGVAICYDLRFPEVFQALADQADLILVPANWPSLRRAHWNCLLPARAVETLSYVAGINCAGWIGGQAYSGDSACFSPEGLAMPPQILPGESDCPEERILLYQLTEKPDAYRAYFPVRRDRRPELYASWYA